MKKYLIGLLKIGVDLFALPDLYTYMLFRANYYTYYFLIPYSLFIDIVLGYPLGTFFIIDFGTIGLYKLLIKWIRVIDYVFVFYFIRYTFLHIVIGQSTIHVFNQISYCFCFWVIFRIIRGVRIR